MKTGALLSEDRAYRYALYRTWDTSLPVVMFIGLNPSTADETEDDPTIRRCIRFAKDWGYGGLYMTNLFAIRATDPKDMLAHKNPTGTENDYHLITHATKAGMIVCAWGAHGGHQGRNTEVLSLLNDHQLNCLGTTKTGHPRHPLYLRADTQPVPYGFMRECNNCDCPECGETTMEQNT